jgi:Ca-activated chloride channel family protein
LSLAIGDTLAEGRHPESPSHSMRLAGDGTVELVAEEAAPSQAKPESEVGHPTVASKGAALDRDLVVRWTVAGKRPGLALDLARPSDGKAHAARAYGLLTLLPPDAAPRKAAVARDLCLLIDTSGSMSGEPLDQARRVLGALVDTLSDADTLEMIEFSSQPSRWKKEPARASEKARADAKCWLGRLTAGGGTEMRSGLLEALSPLRADSQRQIVLVSDGAIGFESEIVADILAKLPESCRVHTVGVGSAVNRSLTQPAARAGRGVELIIGLGEDPERAVARIVARTEAPLVVDLSVEGSALVERAPKRLPDLFAGAPALLSLALDANGGDLVVRGRTTAGEWSERLVVPPVAYGVGNGAATALFGRELVEDLEMRVCAGEDAEALARAIEKVGLEFQISTRLTSWVAISDEPAVDPRAPSRRVKIPQALPHGLSVDGLGLRPLKLAVAGAAPAGMLAMATPMAPMSKRTRAVTKAGAYMGPPPVSAAESAPFGFGGFEKKQALGRTLRGRIKKQLGRELIVEIDVDEDFDWTLGEDALVDGVHATVDAARSSASMRARAGQTLRLVLVVDEEPRDAPSTIDLGTVTIAVI